MMAPGQMPRFAPVHAPLLLPGAYFEMRVHPQAGAQALTGLARRLGIPGLEGTIHA